MGKVESMKKHDLESITGNDRRTNFWKEYRPVNALTGREYRGMNRELLAKAARESGAGQVVTGRKTRQVHCFVPSYWATWKQWRALGCRPNRGERPARIYHRNVYHGVFGFWQVRVETEAPGPELLEVLAEVEALHREQAALEARPGPEDWQGWRWAHIREAQGR